MQEADLVLSNVDSPNGTTLYEIGISHALNKPAILLVDSMAQVPFDFLGCRYLTYDPQNLSGVLAEKLAEMITDALSNPKDWIVDPSAKRPAQTRSVVFVSYSHNDLAYLTRLKIHMKPLERKSIIHLWSDTLIQGGDKWKQKIESALDRAVIAILLVSADFLASDFIVDNELQPLLKAAEKKGTTIIPVIVKPCRFLREKSISQFQAMNDPQVPLCKLSEFEQESVYEQLAQRIELALDAEK